VAFDPTTKNYFFIAQEITIGVQMFWSNVQKNQSPIFDHQFLSIMLATKNFWSPRLATKF
jgi:hypothetical protein